MIEKQSINSKGGARPGAGRKQGVPNRLSATVKDNIIEVFEGVGGVDAMTGWAKENPTQFFNLYAKLLPLTVAGDSKNPLELIHRIELVAKK